MFTEINFDVQDNKLTNVRFIGGCSGNTGPWPSESGNGRRRSDQTSRRNPLRSQTYLCPDQLAKALKQYKESFPDANPDLTPYTVYIRNQIPKTETEITQRISTVCGRPRLPSSVNGWPPRPASFHHYPDLHKYLRNGTFLHCRFSVLRYTFERKEFYLWQYPKKFHPAGGSGEYTQNSNSPLCHFCLLLLTSTCSRKYSGRKFHCRLSLPLWCRPLWPAT